MLLIGGVIYRYATGGFKSSADYFNVNTKANTISVPNNTNRVYIVNKKYIARAGDTLTVSNPEVATIGLYENEGQSDTQITIPAARKSTSKSIRVYGHKTGRITLTTSQGLVTYMEVFSDDIETDVPNEGLDMVVGDPVKDTKIVRVITSCQWDWGVDKMSFSMSNLDNNKVVDFLQTDINDRAIQLVAKENGEATVRVTDQCGKTAKIKVRVTGGVTPSPLTFDVSPTNLEPKFGETVYLNINVKGYTDVSQTFLASQSSDESIAKIGALVNYAKDNCGSRCSLGKLEIKAIKEGTANINLILGNNLLTKSISIVVKANNPAPAGDVAIEAADSVSVEAGKETSLTFKISGASASSTTITSNIVDKNIASATSPSGGAVTIKGLNAGKTSLFLMALDGLKSAFVKWVIVNVTASTTNDGPPAITDVQMLSLARTASLTLSPASIKLNKSDRKPTKYTASAIVSGGSGNYSITCPMNAPFYFYSKMWNKNQAWFAAKANQTGSAECKITGGNKSVVFMVSVE